MSCAATWRGTDDWRTSRSRLDLPFAACRRAPRGHECRQTLAIPKEVVGRVLFGYLRDHGREPAKEAWKQGKCFGVVAFAHRFGKSGRIADKLKHHVVHGQLAVCTALSRSLQCLTRTAMLPGRQLGVSRPVSVRLDHGVNRAWTQPSMDHLDAQDAGIADPRRRCTASPSALSRFAQTRHPERASTPSASFHPTGPPRPDVVPRLLRACGRNP